MVYTAENGTRVYEQDGCKGVRLYEAAGNEYVHLFLEPGGSIPEHALPMVVSFCVLKGQGICTVSGHDQLVCFGEMVECPSDLPRGWRNESDEPLEVLAVKRLPSAI